MWLLLRSRPRVDGQKVAQLQHVERRLLYQRRRLTAPGRGRRGPVLAAPIHLRPWQRTLLPNVPAHLPPPSPAEEHPDPAGALPAPGARVGACIAADLPGLPDAAPQARGRGLRLARAGTAVEIGADGQAADAAPQAGPARTERIRVAGGPESLAPSQRRSPKLRGQRRPAARPAHARRASIPKGYKAIYSDERERERDGCAVEIECV